MSLNIVKKVPTIELEYFFLSLIKDPKNEGFSPGELSVLSEIMISHKLYTYLDVTSLNF